MTKKIYIKNMVCNRCVKVVRDEFEKFGLTIKSISLGEVEVEENEIPTEKVRSVLEENGFELIEDKRNLLVEQIKNTIISAVQNSAQELEKENLSGLIEKEVPRDYNYLSSLFSSIEGITIEHYFILQKIERAKELLKYDELTLSEISFQLGYSSVQHLSNQFKKVTGMTASQFKNMTRNTRKPLDKII